MNCSYIIIISKKKYILIEVGVGTSSVLLGNHNQHVFIEIVKTVTLVIN